MTHDPHQAAEASAFALMPQAGPAAIDTTGDLFGFDADDLEHWQAERTTRRQRVSPGPDLFSGLSAASQEVGHNQATGTHCRSGLAS